MTAGFEVFVQLVMAAMTTSPSFKVFPAFSFSTSFRKAEGACASGTRSCGRLGPETLGSTVDRSISRISLNSGGGVFASRHKPCALQ